MKPLDRLVARFLAQHGHRPLDDEAAKAAAQSIVDEAIADDVHFGRWYRWNEERLPRIGPPETRELLARELLARAKGKPGDDDDDLGVPERPTPGESESNGRG